MSNDVKINKNKVLKLRAVNCWSQEELASVSGLSVRTIQRVEKTGTGSLETTKALASVFEVSPNQLQLSPIMEASFLRFFFKYAWLVAFALASVFFGSWIVDILIPTLKGADFNQQYELHGNFRYLDFGGISFFLGFLLVCINWAMDFVERKKLTKDIGELS